MNSSRAEHGLLVRSLLLLVTLAVFIGVSPARAQAYLHAAGIYIVDGNNAPFLLRGMGLGGWLVPEGYMLGTTPPHDSPTGFRQAIESVIGAQNTDAFFTVYRNTYVRHADIDSLARWGFNSIRLPFHYGIVATSPGVYSESGFAIFDSLLSWCEQDHIYLILDMHCAPGGQNTGNISDYQGPPSLWESAAYQQWTAEIWKEIARRYAKRQWIGGYDLLNETAYSFPGGSNAPLRDLFVRITDSIRTVDVNHLVFAEGNNWATDFSDLTPAWDTNMAWSFHKYWNDNSDPSSILTYMSLRGSSGTPLWMGESGENSNEWFAEAVALLERYKIGWSWWTLKKIESIACPLSVHRSANYATLLNYWNNGGTAPGVAFSLAALNEQIALFDASQCAFHPDFIDALFRAPFTTGTREYAANQIPGVIHAVNFDMGRNGYAYYDVDFQNVSGPGGSTYNSGGQYRNDGVDIEACSDAGSNGYNVGWTAAGEFLSYTVYVQSGGLYDITVRVSSGANGGSAKLSWDGTDMASPFSIPPTGGWQAWTSVDLGSFALDAGTHNLRISMMSAGFNINRAIFTLLASEVGKNQTRAPERFALEQNYPNPFNPGTVIRYSIPRASHVRLEVYNLLGERVRTLVDQEEQSGAYSVRFDASDLSSGVYFYRLDAGSYSETRKLALLR